MICCCDLLFETSAWYPPDRCWPLLGSPGSFFFTFGSTHEPFNSTCRRFQSNISILRKQMAPATPHNKTSKNSK